jgi:formylglycine-generating enzyme required for sulfatase activity
MKIAFLAIFVLLCSMSVFPQTVTGQDAKLLKKWEFIAIPTGTTEIEGKKHSFDAFYMLEAEVSNDLYNQFLADLKAAGNEKALQIATVEDERWKAFSTNFNKRDTLNYSKRADYANYPVCNISYEAAQLFCKWLTDKLNHPDWTVSLPTRNEWIYAASGHTEHTYNIYPWSTPYLTNMKGQVLCNYLHISDGSISNAKSHYTEAKLAATNTRLQIMPDSCDAEWQLLGLSDLAGFPLPAQSFYKYGFGLYNMSGNVAEMVEEEGIAVGGSWNDPGYDVRITSFRKYMAPSPMVGFRPVLKILIGQK